MRNSRCLGFLTLLLLLLAGPPAVAAERWATLAETVFDHRFKVFKEIDDDPDSLPADYIKSLLVDDQGRLWIGTSSAGLARYDAGTDRFVRYPAGPGGLSNPEVRALAGDGDGGVWVGTATGLAHRHAMDQPFIDVRPGRGRRRYFVGLTTAPDWRV